MVKDEGFLSDFYIVIGLTSPGFFSSNSSEFMNESSIFEESSYGNVVDYLRILVLLEIYDCDCLSNALIR